MELVIVECPKCRQRLQCEVGGVGTCPNCGTKINFPSSVLLADPKLNKAAIEKKLQSNRSQQIIEIQSVKKKSKKKIFVLVALMLALVGGGFGGYSYYKKQVYLDDVQTLLSVSDATYRSCEYISELTIAVWNDSVFRNKRSETRAFVYPSGIHKDFNEAIKLLFSDSQMQQAVALAKGFQLVVNYQTNKLKDTPVGLENLQNAAIELSSATSRFSELTLSPEGNLTSFSDTVRNLGKELKTKYDNLDKISPEPNEKFLEFVDKIMFWKDNKSNQYDKK